MPAIKNLAVVIVLVFIIIVITHILCDSQPERYTVDKDLYLQNIKGLVFSGAGTLGYAMIGGLEELQQCGLHFNNVNYFAGTSAGAILSAFLACRINIEDIKKYIFDVDIKKTFIDNKEYAIDRIKRKSLYDGYKMEIIIEKFLQKHTGIENITFQQIYEKYGTTVIITAVNVKNIQDAIYFSRFNYPNIPVAKAIRASSSLALIFDPVNIDDMVLVDGGYLDLLPIKELQKYVPLSQITGIYLDTDIKYLTDSWKKIPYYMGLNSKMVRRRFRRNRLTKEEKQRIVVISFHDQGKEYSPINFNMTEELKNNIYNIGVLSTQKFLNGSEFHV